MMRSKWTLDSRIALGILLVVTGSGLLPGCGGNDGGKPTDPGDTTPPAAVTDLSLTSVSTSLVTLSWTAPGDDGHTGTVSLYDLRRSISGITESNFGQCTPVAWPGTCSAAGLRDTLTVTGLSADTRYYFAFKSQDDARNLSGLSNVVQATTTALDFTPPAAVTNLSASPIDSTDVELSWTAPGDDDRTGTAQRYDIRYSPQAITEGTWPSAIPVSYSPTPAVAGTVQSTTVPDLHADTDYYFALKAADEVPRWSGLSNVAFAHTPPTAEPAMVQLTFDWGSVSGPTWSSDGTRIAFTSDRTGNGDLYAMWATGGTPVELTDTEETEADPSWHGSRIAVAVSRRAYDYPPCISLVADTGGRPSTIYPIVWGPSEDAMIQPSWAPDGRSLLFVSRHGGNGPRIYTMLASIHDTPAEVTPYDLSIADDFDPIWSRDGVWVAFASTRSSRTYNLWMVAPGTPPVRLTTTEATDRNPTWSPDGSRIAFSSTRNGLSNLWIIAATSGSQAHQLTVGSFRDSDPAWSPDGNLIAFVSDRGGSKNLWVLTVPEAFGAGAQ